MFTPGGPQDVVDQLILAAFECAVSIRREAGSPVNFNAYQLDLFLFKDMGIGGILSKFISRMNDAEIGGYEGYFLPEPVATWYGSFYTDYVTYLDSAGRDSVLAAHRQGHRSLSSSSQWHWNRLRTGHGQMSRLLMSTWRTGPSQTLWSNSRRMRIASG